MPFVIFQHSDEGDLFKSNQVHNIINWNVAESNTAMMIKSDNDHDDHIDDIFDDDDDDGNDDDDDSDDGDDDDFLDLYCR